MPFWTKETLDTDIKSKPGDAYILSMTKEFVMLDRRLALFHSGQVHVIIGTYGPLTLRFQWPDQRKSLDLPTDCSSPTALMIKAKLQYNVGVNHM